jgi:hypothetical protein
VPAHQDHHVARATISTKGTMTAKTHHEGRGQHDDQGHVGQRLSLRSPLKGQKHEIFDLWFFFINQPHLGP